MSEFLAGVRDPAIEQVMRVVFIVSSFAVVLCAIDLLLGFLGADDRLEALPWEEDE